MLDARLCIANLEARTGEEVLRALAARLVDVGVVNATFADAAVAREKRSPTGLPFDPIAVALPHAEPAHVVAPAIAVASLAKPVAFRQMGSPAVKLSVSLVVVPALTEKDQAAGELSRILERLQDEGLRRALVEARDAGAILAALAPFSGAP